MRRLLIALTACVASTAASAAAKRPNILLIIGDDWGWGDLGAYGGGKDNYHSSGTMISTPNLDKFAKQSTLFTDFHVAQSFCAPSRTAFMTGRFPADLSVNNNWNEGPKGWIQNHAEGLPYYIDPKLPNVANLLHNNGYRTAHYGKWHLGGFAPPNATHQVVPSEYGFDETATYNSIVATDPETYANATNAVAGGSMAAPWWSADVDADSISRTQAFMKASIQEQKPFYINLWLHMSHDTIDPRPEWYNTTFPFQETCLFPATQAGETICPGQVYYGAQTYTDGRLGRLFDYIDNLGIRNDTLVVFTTDNGQQTRYYTSGGGTGVFDNAVGSAGPFCGNKASLYEGGQRVPFIASWPGQIPQGRIDHSLISSVDWVPTLAALTGTPLPRGAGFRGQDISEILRGGKTNVANRETPLFWRGGGGPPPCWQQSPSLAVRTGDLKLLFNPLMDRIELYNISSLNLAHGFFEQQNLAEQLPHEVQRLSQLALAWHNSIPPVRPGATNQSLSIPGCMAYKMPGL